MFVKFDILAWQSLQSEGTGWGRLNSCEGECVPFSDGTGEEFAVVGATGNELVLSHMLDHFWSCTAWRGGHAHLHVPQRGWANRAMAANAGGVAVAVQDKPGRTPLDLLKVRGELVGVGVPDGAGIYSAIGQNMAFYASSTPSSSFSGNPGFCWLWRRCCQCAAPKTGRNAGWLTPIEVLGGGHSLKCAGSGSRRQ